MSNGHCEFWKLTTMVRTAPFDYELGKDVGERFVTPPPTEASKKKRGAALPKPLLWDVSLEKAVE